MIRSPQTGIWRQLNIGDRFGDIMRSFNIDLSSEQGKVKISPRLIVNASSADDAQLLTPFAIIFNETEDKWHIGAGDDFFVGGDAPNEAITEDTTSTDQPSFQTTARPDLAYFNGLTFGMASELYRLDAGGADWDQVTTGGTALGGSINGAPLIPFGATNRLYYRVNTYKIGSINTSETPVVPSSPNTTPYTLDLGDITQVISCGKASSDFIWLGTIAEFGKKARVHQWNGSSVAVTRTYEIDAQGVLAMAIFKNVPIILDSNGVLRHLNGGAFVEVGRLPFKDYKPLRSLTGAHTAYLTHYNGMIADDNRVRVLVNPTYADGTTDENVPGGIWEYNQTNGFFHYASPVNGKSGDTVTDYGSLKINTVGALAIAKTPDSDSNGNLLAGIGIFTNASSTKTGVWYNDTNKTLQTAGTVIFTKKFSPNLIDSWKEVTTRFRKFRNATDKIVFKARTTEDEPDEITITYVDTTSFTATAASFNRTPVVGDEVEILQGVGAGRCTHITAITGTTTFTITVDETITGATTQTAKALFQTWKKLGTYNSQDDEIYHPPMDQIGASAWIQLKVWILWTGKNEIYDQIINNEAHQLIA